MFRLINITEVGNNIYTLNPHDNEKVNDPS